MRDSLELADWLGFYVGVVLVTAGLACLASPWFLVGNGVACILASIVESG